MCCFKSHHLHQSCVSVPLTAPMGLPLMCWIGKICRRHQHQPPRTPVKRLIACVWCWFATLALARVDLSSSSPARLCRPTMYLIPAFPRISLPEICSPKPFCFFSLIVFQSTHFVTTLRSNFTAHDGDDYWMLGDEHDYVERSWNDSTPSCSLPTSNARVGAARLNHPSSMILLSEIEFFELHAHASRPWANWLPDGNIFHI